MNNSNQYCPNNRTRKGVSRLINHLNTYAGCISAEAINLFEEDVAAILKPRLKDSTLIGYKYHSMFYCEHTKDIVLGFNLSNYTTLNITKNEIEVYVKYGDLIVPWYGIGPNGEKVTAEEEEDTLTDSVSNTEEDEDSRWYTIGSAGGKVYKPNNSTHDDLGEGNHSTPWEGITFTDNSSSSADMEPYSPEWWAKRREEQGL